MFSRSALLLLLTYSAFSQSSAIQGVVSDDSGNSPTGIYVVATLLSPSDHRTFTTVTGANGTYSFSNLPAGTYSVCVQSPGGGHLNNCHWGAPVSLALAASQTLSRNLSITQGALFQLRLDDPQNLISPTDDLMLGVFLPNGFSPMRLASADPTGRSYDLAVPLKTSVRLNVISTRLQIADDKGKALGAPGNIGPAVTSAVITFPGQSALHGPPLTFTVTGRK
jgi:hypothetical protein